MQNILTGNPTAAVSTEALEAMGSLDDAIHQKARMGIMSMLIAVGESDFKQLKETLGLSDGNLSAHLTLLEERGYVEIHKEFVRKKPRTSVIPTTAGRNAFLRYVATLERIVKAASAHGSILDPDPIPADTLPLD